MKRSKEAENMEGRGPEEEICWKRKLEIENIWYEERKYKGVKERGWTYIDVEKAKE